MDEIARRVRGRCLSALGRTEEAVQPLTTAFDLARTLTRLGAKVTMLSWFSEAEIPADKDEIREALEEGITITDRTQITAFHGEDGHLTSLACRATQPGPPDAQGIAWPVIDDQAAPWTMDFDLAFVAVGQVGSFGAGSAAPGLNWPG
mgnify:CR=1 FL=1